MDRIKIKIYVLIMLECRLSMKDASMIFGVDEVTLAKEIKQNAPREIYHQPLDYLRYESSLYPEENKRGKLKAATYYRRFLRIMAIKDRKERVDLLNNFIIALSGPDIRSALGASHIFNKEERELILKYRLKYGKTNIDLKQELNLSHNAIKKWEEDLPEDSEMKIRLRILREYCTMSYKGPVNPKR